MDAPLSKQTVGNLQTVLLEIRPDIVAIDSPPDFGVNGRSRLAERSIMRLGIGVFATPSDPMAQSRPFYRWIQVGREAFRATERAGFRVFRGHGPVIGHAIEVFPFASAVCLRGSLPVGPLKRKSQRAIWRRAVLAERGVPTETLRTLDQVDAALAALTGMLALERTFMSVGSPTEGVIVLPVVQLPQHYVREAPSDP